MITTTDLSNRALSTIGEMRIADIEDTESTAARVCREFIQPVIDEVLRSHRWNCAIGRATLSQLSEGPNHGFDRAYQLPPDFIRLLEVNGEQFEGSDEFFEIEEASRLLTNEAEAKIRYVKRITVDAFDPLLAKAVATALASAICIPLNKNVQMQQSCEVQHLRAIRKAQTVDAIEVGSREVRPLDRLRQNSPLVRSRRAGVRDPLRYRLP